MEEFPIKTGDNKRCRTIHFVSQLLY